MTDCNDSITKDAAKPQIEDAFKNNNTKSLFGGQIVLNPSISVLNFCAYLLMQFTYTFVVLSIDSFQMPLLQIQYGVSKDDVDTVNSIILVFDLVFKIMISPIYGYLCDKFGRRAFVMYGLASFTAAALLYPVFSQVYPYAIFVRLLFANGVISINIAPLLADYIDYNTKGRMAGILTLIGSFSGYIASFFQQSDNLSERIHAKFLELAIGCGILGIFISIGIKGGTYHRALYNDPNAARVRHMLQAQESSPKKVGDISLNNDSQVMLLQGGKSESDDIKQAEEEEKSKKESKLQRILAGFKQARNPWILIGFMVTYLGVAQGGILTFVLVSWVSAKTGGDPNQATQSYALSNKASLALVVSALVFGFFSDKYSKFKMLLVTLFCAISGVFFLIFAPTPYNWMAYMSMVMTGFGNSGFSIALNTLVYKYAEPRYRAAVSSAAQILHVLGFANSSLLGVYLVQFNMNIPLYIYATSCGITLTTLIVLYSTSKVMRKL